MSEGGDVGCGGGEGEESCRSSDDHAVGGGRRSDGRQMATMVGVGPAMAGAMAGVVAGRAPMAELVATTAATRAAVSGLV